MISSRERKHPRQVSASSRQQFRTQGDGAAAAVSLIANPCDWRRVDSITPAMGAGGNGSLIQSVVSRFLVTPESSRCAGVRGDTHARGDLGDMQPPADARGRMKIEGCGKLSGAGGSIIAAASHSSAHPSDLWVIVPLDALPGNSRSEYLALRRGLRRDMYCAAGRAVAVFTAGLGRDNRSATDRSPITP